MNQYIIDRLDPQIKWYAKKAASNQRRYKILKFIEAILTLSIAPSAYWLSTEDVRNATIIIGFFLSLLLAIQKIFMFQDNWVNYRQTAELLISEKHMALARAGDYAQTSNINSLLVERTESIMAQEHARWGALASRQPQIHSSTGS